MREGRKWPAANAVPWLRIRRFRRRMRPGHSISWRRAFWIRGQLVDLGLLGVRPRANLRVRMFRRPKGGIGRRNRHFCLFRGLFSSRIRPRIQCVRMPSLLYEFPNIRLRHLQWKLSREPPVPWLPKLPLLSPSEPVAMNSSGCVAALPGRVRDSPETRPPFRPCPRALRGS